MKRQIIKIDEDMCNGCGNCITGCHEGALQLIDGKARLISDLFCDGLGACIGSCPQGAIVIEEREAEPYDEIRVMQQMIHQGANTIKAHLKHMKDHGEMGFYNQALNYLKEQGYDLELLKENEADACGCAGGNPRHITPKAPSSQEAGHLETELRQWPVQLHLINPSAGYFDDAELLISADCVPYAYADYHRRFLKGKVVITFCPKLDKDIDRYIDKLAEIFKLHKIKSLNIVRMEVPCCGGTELIVQKALEKAGKMHFVKINIISIDGNII
ncbi:MAG: 4Fe-4S dicluster domain-containing protein [Candidatus Cloacimonetes bacterium]|nr:4Fe-4S dicluster domain-containing protein [Candidatus Cloacimonadota bacterium]